jgi:Ca2+/Na+ antiporter
MPWIITAVLLIGGLMGMRAAIPLKSSYFVRYIYVITTVAAVLLGQGLAWLEARGYRSVYMLGCLMAGLYVLLCILLMMAKFAESLP